MTISKVHFRLLLLSNIICLGLILFIMISGKQTSSEFEVITAERLNIVNEDGTTVIAIANNERVAPPVMDGVEYPLEIAGGRQYLAGMVFFNQNGDEMGGLLFNSFQFPDGTTAGVGHLSFDRFRDNQVLALQYNENRNGIRSGLTIFDRPGDGSFSRSMDLISKLYQDSLSQNERTILRDSLSNLTSNRGLGGERLFLGSKNEVPQLTMNDLQGKKRIGIFIDSTNTGRIQFFDEAGNVVSEFSGEN